MCMLKLSTCCQIPVLTRIYTTTARGSAHTQNTLRQQLRCPTTYTGRTHCMQDVVTGQIALASVTTEPHLTTRHSLLCCGQPALLAHGGQTAQSPLAW